MVFSFKNYCRRLLRSRIPCLACGSLRHVRGFSFRIPTLTSMAVLCFMTRFYGQKLIYLIPKFPGDGKKIDIQVIIDERSFRKRSILFNSANLFWRQYDLYLLDIAYQTFYSTLYLLQTQSHIQIHHPVDSSILSARFTHYNG